MEKNNFLITYEEGNRIKKCVISGYTKNPKPVSDRDKKEGKSCEKSY